RFSRDWSSDVCSSDLAGEAEQRGGEGRAHAAKLILETAHQVVEDPERRLPLLGRKAADGIDHGRHHGGEAVEGAEQSEEDQEVRSEERRVGKECRGWG